MFHLELFKIRMFAMGNLAGFLSSLARGGLQFMLIIWLQGIWLPLHGYAYKDTPLWAGIYTMPMMVGFMASGPLSGALSDRFGARVFSTGGMLLTAVGFILLTLLPGDFQRLPFFGLLLLLGIGMGLFAAPNTTSIMNAVPAEARGAASGMIGTFQNAGMMVSMAVFFSILTSGLSVHLPSVMFHGLTHNGLPAVVAQRIAHLPPIGVLFAAFLGYNPMKSLVPAAVAQHLGISAQTVLFGKRFFPQLILPAFMDGLKEAFGVSVVMALVAALASLLRGKRYIYGQRGNQIIGHQMNGATPAVAGIALALLSREAQRPDADPALLAKLSELGNGKLPPDWPPDTRGRIIAQEYLEPLAVGLLASYVTGRRCLDEASQLRRKD
jgi:MFS family permease